MLKTVKSAALIVLINCVFAQCATDSSPQLRFVAQLSVSGCALFVHETGAIDGPHLVVEPIMCVTKTLREVAPRYDPVTEQTYVSVPVTVTNDAMLAEVQRQLRHLSPKTVKFATMSDIQVSTDASSKFQALGWIWSVEEPEGFLRLGCKTSAKNCSVEGLTFSFQNNQFEALGQVTLAATVVSNGTTQQLQYRPMLQNSSFLDINVIAGRFESLPKCQQLRFFRSIRLNNCTVQVHQRQDMKGEFHIEPLLCHNVTSRTNKSVVYDYSRGMYYLRLDLVLQDDVTKDAVRTQLADLSPRSVTFTRLWRAQSHVTSALSRRFMVDPLRVSGDGRSAELRVYNERGQDCGVLRSALEAEPVDVWRHVRWSASSLMPGIHCILESRSPRHTWRMRESGQALKRPADLQLTTASPRRAGYGFEKTVGGRRFMVIQQRLTGSVSFQRTWVEYEQGFGEGSNFWIGLSEIHLLSKNGATLRVEMKLWDGTEQHAEYAGFSVGDASTKYTMTHREMLRDRSTVTHDAMEKHDVRGRPFSTMDKDNDGHGTSCSNEFGGKGGWWFNNCSFFHPNGIYGGAAAESGMNWYQGGWLRLQEVRLMLQI